MCKPKSDRRYDCTGYSHQYGGAVAHDACTQSYGSTNCS
ncbi:hypothetical protein CBM2586_B130598 [Cupriavidus phytorum]|uniref:Uncharacterized protein n=1 Tax=Cupriavidus taiwanensis TaxID=164546 RepID=A0A975XLB8_9BURK|nr:hypothetical protein CBM2586_B130598 [Cupriavidus taiwanensis]